MNTVEYLDAAKEKLGGASDYKLAKTLGRQGSWISRFRHSEATFDEEACVRIAEILEIDPITVIADMQLLKKRTNREFWEGVKAKSAGTAAAIIATTVLCAIPSESVASVANTIDLTTDSNMYYARYGSLLERLFNHIVALRYVFRLSHIRTLKYA